MSSMPWMNGPSEDGVAVTPSDSTPLSFRSLWIGGAGDVTVKTLKGNIVLYENVPAQFILPIAGTRVMAATTATKITTFE